MQIRPFQDNDRASIIDLWHVCGLIRPWNDPATDIDLAARAQNAQILVGVLDGELIATIMLGYDGHRGWVYYLAITPNRQGRGYGRAMMIAAEDWLKARGAPKIQLMVRDDNRAALGFYDALDYKVQETTTLGKRLDGR